MSVEFQEETSTNSNQYNAPVPKIAAWLIKKNFAKDEDSANRIEIIVSIVCFALALYFFL